MMRRTLCFAVLAFAATACGSTAATSENTEKADRGDKGDGKGVVITLDGLRSRTPADWQEQKTSSKMRMAQFRLPHVKGDDRDAELVIFKGLGGSVKANLDRWKAQFKPPEGKSIDDVAKVKEIKIGGHDATLLNIHGTYNPPPFDPNFGGKPHPGFRLLAVQFQGPENPYQIKLIGPSATVEHFQKGFENWLQGFKKE